MAAARNPDWYVFLGSAVVVLFWLQAIATVMLSIQPWAGAPAADVPIAVGVFAVLAYPFWVRLGAGAVFLAIGRSPSEGGLLWAFRLRDRTEPFEAPWEK
ncbi:MAG: hypothetical protein U5K37_07315 [Natrialbaceae archaeon]|nr:hypothetical protein [Natrialbaceae archaeon]